MKLPIALLTALLLTFLAALPAQACPAREDLADIGSEPGAALADCTEVSRFTIPTGRGDVEVTVYGGPEVGEPEITDLLYALTEAGSTLRDIGPFSTDPVEIYLSPTPYVPLDGEDLLAVTDRIVARDGGTPQKTCLFAMFPSIRSDEFVFTAAHEFFHCVQFKDFGAQMGADDSQWWSEGTAEWFPNRVFQGRSNSDGFVEDFDAHSETTALTSLTYENVVFFFWLDANYGSGRIFDLMGAMATGGSQDDALEAFLEQDQFQQFARDYIDKKITQPGGRSIPSNPIFTERIKIDRSKDIELEAERFTIARIKLELPCGEWKISDEDRKGRYGIQRREGEEWQVSPMTVTSEGDPEIRLKYVATGTGADGQRITLKFEKAECVPCRAPDFSTGPAAALVGSWTLASGGTGAKIGQMLERVDSLENVDYPDIDKFLTLDSDGTFILSSEDSGSMDTVSEGGERFSANFRINMERRGTWSIDGNILSQCYVRDVNLNIDETVEAPDGLMDRIIGSRFLGAKQSYTVKRGFTVEGNTLTLTEKAFMAPTITWIYEK